MDDTPHPIGSTVGPKTQTPAIRLRTARVARAIFMRNQTDPMGQDNKGLDDRQKSI